MAAKLPNIGRKPLFSIHPVRDTELIHFSLLLLTSIPIYATEGSEKSEFGRLLGRDCEKG
jgi:hypothetical protein